MRDHELGDGNWADVRTELARRFPSWQAPLDTGDLWYASPPLDPKRARAAADAPILRAFVWGFHLELSGRYLRELVSVANPVNELVAALGPVRGPAAPFIALAAAFVAGLLHGQGTLEREGIYVSMSWFAPGVFIPTTVRGRVLREAGAG